MMPRASKTLPRQRPAFIGAASVGDRSNLHAGDTKDAGLERITETWVHLQRKQEQLKQPLEKEEAMKVTQEMLEAAIEITRASREVEKELASSAHKTFESAVEKEHALVSAVDEIQVEEDIEGVALNGHDDDEVRRTVTFAETTQGVEDYARSRLREAKQIEHEARMEEKKALDMAKDLENMVQDLKTALEELKVREPQTENE